MNERTLGPWLVFRTSGRLVKVGQYLLGDEQLDAVKALARTIASLPGIPPAPANVRQPKCERATAAAEALLGAKTTSRRDTIDGGIVSCRWATLRKAVFVAGGGPGSEPFISFRNLRDAGTEQSFGNHRVHVGTEGWQQDNGFLAYRVGERTFVDVEVYPMAPEKSASIVALARAMKPAYTR
ncbi:hypothetical protein ACQPXM_28190 [Kribbella sp. CA-253562]|uniref:hypothetical protein n=1 Tax=Kribbella sp. CA-253562 TaxID=3239942 RepID=UPI003D933D1E